MTTSPINSLDLSLCGKFVECWNNGTKIRSVYIGGEDARNLHAAVAVGQTYFREWSGFEGTVSKALVKKMREADGNLQKMAFSGEWK